MRTSWNGGRYAYRCQARLDAREEDRRFKGENGGREGARERGREDPHTHKFTLEKLANIDDCFGFTAKEMTGEGTNILVSVYCTWPSVKESMEEQSTPNMAQTSPALILSISSS